MIQLQDPRNISIDGSTRDLLSQVTRAIEELNKLRPFTADVQSRIRTSLLPDRIVASLNMEGIVATRRQTLDVMDAMRLNESVGKAQQEIFNALKADEFVCDSVDRGVSLTEQFVREINRLLLLEVRADAGTLRLSDVKLPGAPFPPPKPSELAPLLAQLTELFSLAEQLHPVAQAAWIHDQFTLVHPFSDGNGRTGRLLQDFALIRRGLMPVGIPTAQRDDYYAALAQSDKGNWDDLIEMIALLQLSMSTKAMVIAKEPEKRAAWIQKLSAAAAAKKENTLHRQYLVWRHRMEHISQAFANAVKELDESSDNIGAEIRQFGVVEFAAWKQICEFGYMDRNWLFSVVFFADRRPFYKSIAFFERHRPVPSADPFVSERDLVGLYFTGIPAHSFESPPYRHFEDPHIRLREILYRKDEGWLYRQDSPGEVWRCDRFASVEEIVEAFFIDIFVRKAGLGG